MTIKYGEDYYIIPGTNNFLNSFKVCTLNKNGELGTPLLAREYFIPPSQKKFPLSYQREEMGSMDVLYACIVHTMSA